MTVETAGQTTISELSQAGTGVVDDVIAHALEELPIGAFCADPTKTAKVRGRIHVDDALSVVPALAPDQYSALKEDIRLRGQVLVPIEIDPRGRIIDGRARLQAANELGISDYPVIVRLMTSDGEMRELARVLNLNRRCCTNAQKREMLRGQLSETPHYSNRRIAAIFSVDHKTVAVVRCGMVDNGEIPEIERTVGIDETPRLARRPVLASRPRQAERLVDALQTLSPAVADFVGSSRLCDDPGQMLDLCKQPEEVQRIVTQRMEAGSRRQVARLAREVKKDLRTQQFDTPQHDGRLELDTVKQENIWTLADRLDLPAECADLFVVDPPWDHEAVKLYGAAARLAQHLLKPGHFGIFLTGKAHLAEIIHEIEPYLEYRWLLAEFQPESEQRCYPVCAFSKFRPTLVFWKPGPSAWTGWIPDAFWSGKAKQWHEWEQSPETFRKVIPAFTTPEALIVDPMVGGGTVPAVAKALGRHYLGFDVEPAAVATTLERLSGIEFGCELTSDDGDSEECAA